MTAASAQTVPLPPGQVIVGPIGNPSGPSLPSITTGADANVYVEAVEGGFIPTAPATVVRTSVPTQYVRFFNQFNADTLGPASDPWIATTNSVRGLTAAQVKNILALPDLPNAVALVQVPAGTCILGGPGNPALGNFPANPPDVPTAGPWGAAGAPQYYIVGQTATPDCVNPQFPGASTFIPMNGLGPYALAYRPSAGVGNAAAVAYALDHAAFPAPFTPMDSVYNSLDLLNFTDTLGLRGALAQLSGEANADVASVSLQGAYGFLDVLRQQLHAGDSASVMAGRGNRGALTPASDVNVWMDTGGSTAAIGGNGDSHGLRSNFASVTAGLDYRIDPTLKIGAAVGYSRASFSVSGLTSGGDANNYYGAVFGQFQSGATYLDVAAGYGWSTTDLNRSIAFIGQQGVTFANIDGGAFLSSVEGGYRFQLSPTTTITPNVGLQLVSLRQDGFGEVGAGPLALNVAGRDLTSLRSIVAADLKHQVDLGGGSRLVATLRAGWSHELSDPVRSVAASFQELPSAAFVVNGAQPDRDAAVVGAGLAFDGAIQGFVRYDGLLGANAQTHRGSAGVTIKF
ncbi:autotransporter outer membrane beta-barrel domain-containing protein [Chelatococcus reniformis]|uniref:Autotransporter domain-containing protein n=1 Tax=Chelatococcus reniformis TaxID=1494448 RepID=A0A916X821_9HYPH|nr:autotransporter outer membrane beta-barrel domain-containing protein [Chelatococcus reniformis]GGC48650.1 hypothetical protein GCM10010994_04800 [Chelatococcus reniformis]